MEFWHGCRISGDGEDAYLDDGWVGCGINEFRESETKLSKATCHVLCGCERLFPRLLILIRRQFKENEVYYGRWPTFVLQKSVHLILRVYLMKTRANSATPGFECRASPMTSIQLA